MSDQDPEQPFQPLPMEEARLRLLFARLDKLREKARKEAEFLQQCKDSPSSYEPVNTGEPYQPIPNPGWNETRILAEWPDWVEEKPWRILQMRDLDRREARSQAQAAAEGRLADPCGFRAPFGDLSCYQPIENPGHAEASALRDHPDWAQKYPWRLIWRREYDQRCQREAEAAKEAERLLLRQLLTEESEKIFREVVDLELQRREAECLPPRNRRSQPLRGPSPGFGT